MHSLHCAHKLRQVTSFLCRRRCVAFCIAFNRSCIRNERFSFERARSLSLFCNNVVIIIIVANKIAFAIIILLHTNLPPPKTRTPPLPLLYFNTTKVQHTGASDSFRIRNKKKRPIKRASWTREKREQCVCIKSKF